MAGAFYSPPEVARYIVRHTLRGLDTEPGPPQVLDPACGDGVFLEQAFRALIERRERIGPRLSDAQRVTLLCEALHGVDIDRAAVRSARWRLARAALPSASLSEQQQVVRSLADNVRVGDALLEPSARSNVLPGNAPAFDWRVFRAVGQGGGFDAVIGNPPYLNMRRLTQRYGDAVKRHWQRRFRCARGAYDLYVLFLEQAWELLRGGGACGMIVPNKLAVADYAAACRRLLLERTTLVRVADVSALRLFPEAGVYPYIVVWRKRPPRPGHRVRVARVCDPVQLRRGDVVARRAQSVLAASEGLPLSSSLSVESRGATLPLEQLAGLAAGTAGFNAAQMAAALRERRMPETEPCFDFIVSGNIDRYAVRLGDVRFMKRRFRRPVLPASEPSLSARQRELFRGPKIVIAGMSRRLEAALDERGLALGVQVYAASSPPEQTLFLLGVLNSKLLSYLFRQRFAAKRHAGGYLAVNKGQLARLPIRTVRPCESVDWRRRQAIGELACRLQAASAEDPRQLPQRRRQLDARLDALVYELYRLNDAEVEQVEAALPG